MRRVMAGAGVGLLAGLLALAAVLLVAMNCLPYRISRPPQPWPALCNDSGYGAITYLAFPVNLLTNDLSMAILLSPLSLVVYAALGGLLSYAVDLVRSKTEPPTGGPETAG